MITPTVGRVVWYRPAETYPQVIAYDGQPLAALITHVWSNHCVNLVVFDANGTPFPRPSVTLKQADTDDLPSSYAEWMPFQLGQAAKTNVPPEAVR